MPRSYDERRYPGGPPVEPGRFRALRGPKRIGPIRGIVPGDDVEVAREIARLWEALRGPMTSGGGGDDACCPSGAGGLKRWVEGGFVEIYTRKSSLFNWWRLGDVEDPGNNDLGNGFVWANSAPGASSRPLVLSAHSSDLLYALGGPSPPQLASTEAADGALLLFGDGRIKETVGDYDGHASYPFNFLNGDWTVTFWFAPGAFDGTAGGFGTDYQWQIIGCIQMDGSGSWNEGAGIVWRPYVQDFTKGGGLYFQRHYASGDFVRAAIPHTGRFFVDGTDYWDDVGWDLTGYGLPPDVLVPKAGSLNPWQHIGVTYDASTFTMKAYLNGVLVKTANMQCATEPIPGSRDLLVAHGAFDEGVTNVDGRYKGGLDELAMWNEVLTASEIREIYLAGSDPTESGTWTEYKVGPFDLDEDFWSAREISARVYKNSVFSLGDNAVETLTFDRVRHLYNVDHSGSKFTVPEDGRYHIGGTAEFASNATGRRELRIREDGSTTRAISSTTAINGAATNLSVSCDLELLAGQYVELRAFQNRGGGNSLDVTAEFWIHRIT